MQQGGSSKRTPPPATSWAIRWRSSKRSIPRRSSLPTCFRDCPTMARGRAVRDEWQFRRKDGSVFTGQVMSRRLTDGRLQAVFRDISERKEAEESERRLHQISMLSLNTVTLEDVLEAILDAAIAIAHADFGNIQLLDADE